MDRSDGRVAAVGRRRARFLCALLALGTLLQALSGPSPLLAQDAGEGTAQEGALFLLLPTGAQGVSMGRAVTALTTAEAAFWNPAGLAGLERSRFVVFRGDHLVGPATGLSLLFTPRSLGTLGISYQLLDVGDQQITDDFGNVVGEASFRNHLGVLSFATGLGPRLAAGLNFKVVQFRVTCRGECLEATLTSTSYAIDVGLQATPPLDYVPGIRRVCVEGCRNVRLGLMVAHIGPRLQVLNAEQADPLPTRVRFSTAYEVMEHFLPDPSVRLWITAELEDQWRDVGSPSFYLGSEFSAGRGDMVFVRAGYVSGQLDHTDGAAVGIGLNYQRFELGIAKSLASSAISGETEPVHVTFGVGF